MDWERALMETAELVQAALRDWKAAEESGWAAEQRRSGREQQRALREHRRHQEELRKRLLIELRVKEDLLLTAPAGTPGVAAGLANVRRTIARLRQEIRSGCGKGG